MSFRNSLLVPVAFFALILVSNVSRNSNASASLAQACKGQHVVLTFDDGPHYIHTMKVMNALDRAGKNGESIPATFYLRGGGLKSANYMGGVSSKTEDVHTSGNAIIKRIFKNTQWIAGNHTNTHPSLPTKDRKTIDEELNYWKKNPLFNEAVKAQGGYKTFRPPYGAVDESKVMPAIKAAGYDHYMMWDVNSQDWRIAANKVPQSEISGDAAANKKEQEFFDRLWPKDKNGNHRKDLSVDERVKIMRQLMFNGLKKACEERGKDKATPIVVLFHDINPITPAALPGILEDMKSLGVEFKGIDKVEKYSSAWAPSHKRAPRKPELKGKPVLVRPNVSRPNLKSIHDGGKE